MHTKNLRRRIAGAGVAALSVFALAACGVETPTTPAGDNSLTVVTALEPPTMDYAEAGLTIAYMFVAASVSEGLVGYDEASQSIVGVLADEWEWDGDLTWTFHLRPDVTFHSGDTLDAEDVVYTFDRYMAEESTVASDLAAIESVEAVDDMTVEFVTKVPEPILDAYIMRSYITSKEFSEENGDEALATMIDGTGPYILEDWARGERVVLGANADYWGGAPSIGEVTILFREDPSVRASMVKAGEAQLAWAISAEESGIPQLITQPSTNVIIMRPNTISHPALKDVRVRQAMLYAIDQETLFETMFAGVANGIGGNQPVAPGTVGFNSGLKLWEYDPAKAEELINEARADGVDVDSLITINPMGVGRFPSYAEFAEYAAAAWNELGLNVTVETLEVAEWVSLFTSPDPNSDTVADMLYTDSDNPLRDFSRAGRFVTTTGNASLFSNAEIDALYAKAAVLTGEERNAAFQEVAEALVPLVPTFNFGVREVYHAAVEDLSWTPTSAEEPDFKNMKLG